MAEAIDYYFIALRVTHIIAGITWIGLLYWFNFVNVPTFKELDAPTKNILIPRLLKRALLWFRWSAVVTVVAGWLYFFSWWAANNYFSLATGSAVPIGSWDLSILAGALFGTFLLFNVWGIIWVNQKKVIAAVEGLAQGKPLPPEMPVWGKRTLIASRFNMVLSFPMLFFMASASHLSLV
jgi:uncharacterized membrane protein